MTTPLDRRPDPERIDLGAIKAEPQGTSPSIARRDGRECSDRDPLDRAFQAGLPIGSAPTASSLFCRRFRRGVDLWELIAAHGVCSALTSPGVIGADRACGIMGIGRY